MLLRYRFRLYPEPGQRESLAHLFGCVRVVFNDALDRVKPVKASNKPLGPANNRLAEGPYLRVPKSAELSAELITRAKKTPERAWLAEVSSVPLQQALRDADQAWKAHEGSKSGQRAGAPVGQPRFKTRRDHRQSARFTSNAGWRLTAADKLFLPKIGEVKVAWSRDLPSAPTSVTVIKTSCGRYYASFVVDTDPDGHGEHLPPALDENGDEVELALDLGLSAFATDQHGNTIENPRVLRRAERRLKKAQQALSRKQKGSNNRAKARRRVARLHTKVADTRTDWLHKLTTDVVRENQAVYVETLSVKGLARTNQAKFVHDASWGKFFQLLEYKCTRYGRPLTAIDRFHPSSKLCSSCGALQDMPLGERTYRCGCGLVLGRDHNAAKNILAAGRAERLNACGADVRPGPDPAGGDETGTHRKPPNGQAGNHPPSSE